MTDIQNSAAPTLNAQGEDEDLPLDKGNAGSVASWMAFKLESQDYIAVEEVVDSRGAGFFPVGVGFGFDNTTPGLEFAQELAQAAGASSPLCLGYKATGTNDTIQKLWVVFSGLQLKESVTGLSHTTDIVSFLFVKTNGQWGLAVVAPENDTNYSGVLNNLDPCN